MMPFLAGLALGVIGGLMIAALCQIAREADERTERIFAGVAKRIRVPALDGSALEFDDTEEGRAELAQMAYHSRTAWRSARRTPCA